MQPGTLAIAKSESGNAKLGEAATTYAAQQSCPTDCVFFDGGGCYAETGQVGMFVTKPLNESARRATATALDVAEAEARAIDSLGVHPGERRPLRLHTVGDCATVDAAVTVSLAAERYMERGGGPVWTYTHAWRSVSRGAWGEVSVLASCETPADVELARARGYATAMVVEEFPSDRRYAIHVDERSPDSEDRHIEVLPCPQMTRGVACTDCRLCFDGEGLRKRGYSIGFEVHGIPYARRQARLALNTPDDPLRRMPSEQRIAAIRSRYLDEEGREPSVREVCAEISDLSKASVYEWLRYLRGEIVHPAERRRLARAA